MKVLVLFACLVAVTCGAAVGRFYFYGKYGGDCAADGLYYNDVYSFVTCSNGNAYVQPCAPGTRNKFLNEYVHGGYYGTQDFCSVNLNDLGYGAHAPVAPVHRPYYYGYRAYGYPHPFYFPW